MEDGREAIGGSVVREGKQREDGRVGVGSLSRKMVGLWWFRVDKVVGER